VRLSVIWSRARYVIIFVRAVSVIDTSTGTVSEKRQSVHE